MQAVLFKPPGQVWWWLGGMTLLERNLRLLEAAGCKTALVLYPPDDSLPGLAVPRPLGLEVQVVEVAVSGTDPLTILPALELATHEPLFFFDANLLVDRRVLETLKHQTPPCFMVSANGSPNHLVWRVGWFTWDDIAAGNAVMPRAGRVLLGSVASYDEELRGEVPPYCERMRSEPDLTRGWQLLIDRASKRPADLVEKYVDPAIENWLVRKFCDTAITPNEVTLLSIAIALVGASLFYRGWFLLAVLFAWVAIVLDGVDGKLARVKLMPSPTGKFEHVAGFFYENAWYLALAAHLARTQDPAAWDIGVGITTCDICDNIICALFAQFQGKTLDEMSRFDQGFRLIGGRRSIYLIILLAGFLLGRPLHALQTVLWWAGLTVLTHLGRVAYHLLRPAIARVG